MIAACQFRIISILGREKMFQVFTRAALAISRRRVSVCVSVCPHAGIVSKRLNVGSRKQRNVIAQGLEFSEDNILKFALKVTQPLRTQRIRLISAHSSSTVTAGEKWSISTNKKLTTRFLTIHRWTAYEMHKSLTGWNKTRFCCFARKIQLLSKEVCYSFFVWERPVAELWLHNSPI